MKMKITRRAITTPAVSYYGLDDDGVGYIGLNQFIENCSKDVRRAFIEMKKNGMKALVFDLRDNGGGLEQEAVNIVNMFIPNGKLVVSNRGKLKSQDKNYYTTVEPIDTVMPIVVLVNGNTASASEITSGALQDFDRAVIMGTRTYGKGFVQAIHDVPYRGNLKLTVSRYYIPSGRCIQAYDYRHLTSDGRVGTVPDSLTNVFHTRGGREVRDGGGIKPDIEAQPDSLPSLVYDVAQSDELFGYVTQFTRQHPTIAPAGEFSLGDEDYAQFVRHMVNEKFESHRRTTEVLKLLRDAARLEGCYDLAEAAFDSLEARLTPSLESELLRHRETIRPYIEDEIVGRYYYQRGRSQHLLRSDSVYDRAVELLNDKERYRAILGIKD